MGLSSRIHLYSRIMEIPAFLLAAACISISLSIQLSPEKQLIRHLLDQYANVTVHGRPVFNNSVAVHVRFGLGLIQMELDEREKSLSLSLWSKYIWEDYYMQWNPAEYEGIVSVKLFSGLLWLPDIMLYNTAETDISARDTLATVFYNGTIVWVPHQRLKSSCSIDVTNFPFDHQTCHMWFGSWTYPTKDINLSMAFNNGIDLSTFHSDFRDTSQWAIIESRAERRILPSEDVDPNYSVLTYTLKLKRNLVFASYILTLPCVFLACLTLVVFWLPPDRPDRTSLAMSIFASFLLLLLILVEAAPPTASSVPSLGIYYCFNMVIIMMAVFLSSLVVNVCQMGETHRNIPSWLKKLIESRPIQYICCVGEMPTDVDRMDLYRDYSGGSYAINNRKPDYDVTLPKERKPQAEEIPLREIGDIMNDLDSVGDIRSQETQLGPEVRVQVENRNNRRHVANNVFNMEYNQLNDTTEQGTYTQNQASQQQIPDFCGGVDFLLFAKNLERMKCSVQQLDALLNKRSWDMFSSRLSRRHWKTLAIVLDRIFFILYVLLIILSIAILFPRPN